MANKGKAQASGKKRQSSGSKGKGSARAAVAKKKSTAASGKDRRAAAQTQKQPLAPQPAQHQEKPGLESKLRPRPQYEAPLYRGSGKLQDKVALVTGGDSGIGRAVAVLFAREGADVSIVYLPEERSDAEESVRAVEGE